MRVLCYLMLLLFLAIIVICLNAFLFYKMSYVELYI